MSPISHIYNVTIGHKLHVPTRTPGYVHVTHTYIHDISLPEKTMGRIESQTAHIHIERIERINTTNRILGITSVIHQWYRSEIPLMRECMYTKVQFPRYIRVQT